MKNSLKYFVIVLVAFCMFVVGACADEVDEGVIFNSADIPNSTYIIGKHVFTRNTNQNYNGQLTTQLIMKSAKTIDSNSISEMIIYYKTARGNWINGITGDSVQVPTYFVVLFEDTELIYNVDLDIPEVQVLGDSTEYYSEVEELFGDIINYEQYFDGIEVFYKPENALDYDVVVLSTIGSTINSYWDGNNSSPNYSFSFFVPIGYIYTYKVRTFRDFYGDRIYSDFSDDVTFYATLNTPQIGNDFTNCTGYNCQEYLSQIDGDAYFNYYQRFDGIEVFVKDTNTQGDFGLNSDIPYSDLDTIQENNTPFYYHAFNNDTACEVEYKIRTYKNIGNEKVYSNFSNVLVTPDCP